MMKQQKRTASLPLMALSFLLTCVVWLFAESAFVHALPEPATGWVEVQCTDIPEGFSDSATAVFSNTETGETYTITCQKINDYLARMKVPAGSYQVDHVSTADNFAYEAFTDITAFEITKDMPAAQLIPLTVVRHDAQHILPPTDSVSSAPSDDVSATVPSDTEPKTEAPLPENPSSMPSDDNALLDIIDQMASPDASDEQATVQAPSDEQQVLPSVGKVFLVLFGSGVFAALVFGCVWLLRKHFEAQ